MNLDKNTPSELNVDFWNELCGSQLDQTLGIHDNSIESLLKFDNWFMNFYPYLNSYIPFSEFRGKQCIGDRFGVWNRWSENC